MGQGEHVGQGGQARLERRLARIDVEPRAAEVAGFQCREQGCFIKQIAAAVGFRNEKSFSRAFRARVGVSPGEFRQSGGA